MSANDEIFTVRIPRECLYKETDKAWCFQWHSSGKKCSLPKSEVELYDTEVDDFLFEVPQWLIDANDLEFYVE